MRKGRKSFPHSESSGKSATVLEMPSLPLAALEPELLRTSGAAPGKMVPVCCHYSFSFRETGPFDLWC